MNLKVMNQSQYAFFIDKNNIYQYHVVIVSSSLHHYAVQTARTNQSDKINISTIHFLVTQGLSWFWSRTLWYHRVQIPDWLSPWLVDQRSNGSNTDSDILGWKTGKMLKWWDEKIVDLKKIVDILENRGSTCF